MRVSNNHTWVREHKILPKAEINGNLVRISNVRNFNYRSRYDFDARYYDKTFHLDKLESVDVGVVLFSKFSHIAHIITVFEFEKGDKVAFSIERRQRKWQPLKNWLAFFPFYTLIYIIADPSDVIDLRIKHRENEPVNLERLNITKNEAQVLFLDFCKRANQLEQKPEFFNAFFNSCSTNAIEHLNKILKPKIPWLYKYLAPGFLHRRLAVKEQLKND